MFRLRKFGRSLLLSAGLLFCFATPAYALDVTLAWDANTEPALAGYKIYYDTDSGNPYYGTGSSDGNSPIDVPLAKDEDPDVNTVQYTVHNLPAGTYYFVVTAYDNEVPFNESGYSNEVDATSTTTQYQLTAGVTGGNGTVSPTSGTYDQGTVVTLNATPDSGYQVASWSGTDDDASVSNTNTVTMSSDKIVAVQFEPIPVPQYQLTAGVSGVNGTVSPTSGTYDQGTVVTLTAIPDPGYQVASWSGTDDDASISTTNTVTMNSNRSVTVSFNQIPIPQYQLSASVTGGNGTVSPTSGTYAQGTVVTLTATPDAGYRVASWSGTDNDTSISNTNSVSMTSDKSVTLVFSQLPPVINSFSASKTTIRQGESTFMSWDIFGAQSASMNNGIGSVSQTNGSLTVSPISSTTYTLTATNPAGSVSSSVPITVNNGLPVGGYSADNLIPKARIDHSTSGDGLITIRFKVKDPTSDACTLHNFQYSTDNGNAWNAPVNGDSSGSLSSGWQDNAGSKYTSASSFADAGEHSFTFNTKHQDVNGLAGTEQNDVKIRFVVNDGIEDSTSAVSSEGFGVDNLAPTVAISYGGVNSSHVDAGMLTITATFSESLSLVPQITIDRPNPLATIGPVDMTGSGTVFTYSLTVFQENGTDVFDGVNTITISNTIDIMGNIAPPDSSNIFVTDTRDTDSDGIRDYEDTDDDNDGLPDADDPVPLDATGDGGYYGDYDKDGWLNWEEAAKGTDPADPNSYPKPAPPVVKTVKNKEKVVPAKKGKPVTNDSCFAVLLESEAGIDTTDGSAVTFDINDGVSTYQRTLNEQNANGDAIMVAIPLVTGSTTSNELWVVYYRSRENTDKVWPYGANVEVQVMAKDIRGNVMVGPAVFQFRIESKERHDEKLSTRPYFVTGTDGSGATTISNLDTGVKITYTDNVPVQPYFDEEIPFSYLDAESVPVSVHLGPHTFFPNGATVFIPCPGYGTITGSGLMIYGYDGEEWTPIIDSNGNDLTEGTWVIPEWNSGLSWQVHDNGSPSGVTIKVWHFSSFGAGTAPTSVSGIGVEEEGGGCFISALGGNE